MHEQPISSGGLLFAIWSELPCAYQNIFRLDSQSNARNLQHELGTLLLFSSCRFCRSPESFRV